MLDANLRRVETMPLFNGLKEGWGVTRNESRLFVSDGSEYLTFINSHTFENEGRLLVQMPNNQKVRRLNELEYVNGSIWANIFLTSFIVEIDATTGYVTKTINLKSLLDTELAYHQLSEDGRLSSWDYQNNVLNGIAYDRDNDELFVTGKRWSLMFRIKINE